MGQHHQGQVRIGREGRRMDAFSGLLQADRPKDRFGSAVEVVPAASTGGPSTDDGQPRWVQLPQAPAAMEVTQEIQLTLQGATAGITTGVVVPEDAGHRQAQARQPLGDQLLTVAQVTDHQEGVWRQCGQDLFIQTIPLAMQISGDGNAEGGQAVPRLPPSCTT